MHPTSQYLQEKKGRLQKWSIKNQDKFHALVPQGKSKAIDLSCHNKSLRPKAEQHPIEMLSQYLQETLYEQAYEFGYGGYLERRSFYQFDLFTNQGDTIRELHLGLDIWGAAQTPISAPLSGHVHSFHYDPTAGSYGATILLTHQPLPDLTFFTLYGHLSQSSLAGIQVGQPIKGGQQFAHLGAPKDNGGWPPHLHFQIMLDDLGMTGDFPGVAPLQEQEYWQRLCPSPQSIFNWQWE